AARNKLSQWRLTSTQIDQLEESETLQSSFDIISEVSGVVTQRNISVGDFVNKGTVLFEIMDLQKVWVLLDVYENDLSSIQLGDKIIFKANAYPGQTFEGTVSFIDPLLDPQSRTLKIRAEASNPGLLLKPEMFVTALLESGVQGDQESLTIPKSAVLWTGENSVVYVQVGDREHPAFEMREVDLGAAFDDRITVRSGLNRGEEVVSNGAFAVDAAAQLSGHYSMMNRPVTLEVSSSFMQGFDQLMTFYFDLKDQLVSSNGRNAALSAASLHKAHQQINENELDKKGQQLWEEISHPLIESASQIAQSNDLEVQRSQFQTLSDQMILLLEKVGTEKPVYKQYCPMADQDKGAFWLSKEKEVRNPYFGDAMLTCGEVKETYQRKS
ncbi:MAG TPA: efflux RND transporter periplasmic adaptor subunit, partial [Cyclobacteriaceae bacterium]|nr:efflux RND transporter periplasmic adaptor subunit [Cyclobacteriaceae bacterium]